MVSLPDGEKFLKISLFWRNSQTWQTDGDGRTPHAEIYRAYAYASRGNKTLHPAKF